MEGKNNLLSLKMHIYIKRLNWAAMINSIWKHPLESRVKRKEPACRFFNTISQNKYFLPSWKVLTTSAVLTATYSLLNTAVLCSGNSTSVVFFQLDFFPCSARNASPLSAVPFPCILPDRLRRDWLYVIPKIKLITGVFQLLSLKACSLTHADIKNSIYWVIQYISALVYVPE